MECKINKADEIGMAREYRESDVLEIELRLQQLSNEQVERLTALFKNLPKYLKEFSIYLQSNNISLQNFADISQAFVQNFPPTVEKLTLYAQQLRLGDFLGRTIKWFDSLGPDDVSKFARLHTLTLNFYMNKIREESA